METQMLQTVAPLTAQTVATDRRYRHTQTAETHYRHTHTVATETQTAQTRYRHGTDCSRRNTDGTNCRSSHGTRQSLQTLTTDTHRPAIDTAEFVVTDIAQTVAIETAQTWGLSQQTQTPQSNRMLLILSPK